ncbi:MAG: HAD family hydrolase [Phototrophicaceae bacterium]|jgi:HAD superfamily hydrolase (TIGR01509 family)
MTLQAVIFDMDGVLVDSEVYWTQARQAFAAERGLLWTDAFQREAMGQSTVGWATLMRQRLNLTMPVAEIITEMKARVIAKYEERTPTRPGALEAVQLAANHYRVGLASGSPTNIIQSVISLTGLDQLFEVVIYGDTINRGKPAPDIYLEALRQLGVSAAQSVGVEDSMHGIHALKAAGMLAIAAPSPDFPLPPEVLAVADAHITSMEHLSLALLQSLG